METMIFNFPATMSSVVNRAGIHKISRKELPSHHFQFCRHQKIGVRFSKLRIKFVYSSFQGDGGEEPQNNVEELRVPSQWFEPSRASEESEWLRVTLHKWLDDEYCPEATNIEISRVAAASFYKSLVDKQADLGDILLKMAVELESISYQDSFHGAFSSANAAVNLIVERISQE